MPRAGLSTTTVVAAGAALADEVGWDRLTLAALAERLGVRLPSLYKHIDSLQGLRHDIGVLALVELTDAIAAAAVGRAASDALHAMAHAYRTFAHAHPGRYAATVRAPDPGESERAGHAASLLGVIGAVLDGYGIDGPAAVDAIRVLRAGLHGFVSLEAAGGFAMPRSVDASFDELVRTLDGRFSRWHGQPADTDGSSGRR